MKPLSREADQREDLGPKMPEVILSVVMPNYNHAEYLPAALGAILSQSRLPDEIVIVDDGSIDSSREVLTRFASAEPRIRLVFNPENVGAIVSINRGLEAARGKFVCLMAADDVSYPNFFEKALDALKRFPNVALFCAEADVQIMDNAGATNQKRPPIRPANQLRAFNPEETKELLRYNDNFIVTLAAVFRRDVLLSEGGFDLDLGSMADGFLARRLALKYGFCFAPVTVARWQIRNGGLSRTSSSNAEVVLSMLSKVESRLASDPVFPHDYSATFNRRWRFATCRVVLASRDPDWKFCRTVGAQRAIDRFILSVAEALPRRLDAIVALFWLALRWHPYSFAGIADTYIRRCWESRLVMRNKTSSLTT